MAEAEDRCASISVGGWALARGMLPSTPATQQPPRVLGRLIAFARRARALTVEQLAAAADAPLDEVVALEVAGTATVGAVRTVENVARALGLPPDRVLRLAGLAGPCDDALGAAAVRFAARSQPMTALTATEQSALDDFVKVLGDASVVPAAAAVDPATPAQPPTSTEGARGRASIVADAPRRRRPPR